MLAIRNPYRQHRRGGKLWQRRTGIKELSPDGPGLRLVRAGANIQS